MDADELAATRHEPRVIASALVAVATSAVARATGRPSGAPQVAGGSDALARVQRLLRPPAAAARGRRALAQAAVAALAMAPLLLAVGPDRLARLAVSRAVRVALAGEVTARCGAAAEPVRRGAGASESILSPAGSTTYQPPPKRLMPCPRASPAALSFAK